MYDNTNHNPNRVFRAPNEKENQLIQETFKLYISSFFYVRIACVLGIISIINSIIFSSQTSGLQVIFILAVIAIVDAVRFYQKYKTLERLVDGGATISFRLFEPRKAN